MRHLHLIQGKQKLALMLNKRGINRLRKGKGFDSIGAYVPKEDGEGIKHHRLKPLKFKHLSI